MWRIPGTITASQLYVKEYSASYNSSSSLIAKETLDIVEVEIEAMELLMIFRRILQ
jgi:hypothetical protein